MIANTKYFFFPSRGYTENQKQCLLQLYLARFVSCIDRGSSGVAQLASLGPAAAETLCVGLVLEIKLWDGLCQKALIWCRPGEAAVRPSV